MNLFKTADAELDDEESNIENRLREFVFEDPDEFPDPESEDETALTGDKRKQYASTHPYYPKPADTDSKERYEHRKAEETVSTIVFCRKAKNRFMVGGRAMRPTNRQRLSFSAVLFVQSKWCTSICRGWIPTDRNNVEVETSTETTKEGPKG